MQSELNSRWHLLAAGTDDKERSSYHAEQIFTGTYLAADTARNVSVSAQIKTHDRKRRFALIGPHNFCACTKLTNL